jgi:hypothetical protein
LRFSSSLQSSGAAWGLPTSLSGKIGADVEDAQRLALDIRERIPTTLDRKRELQIRRTQ